MEGEEACFSGLSKTLYAVLINEGARTNFFNCPGNPEIVNLYVPMGSKNICVLVPMCMFLASPVLTAKPENMLQHVMPSVSLTPPIPFRITSEEHHRDPDNFHIGTSSAKPIANISGALSVGQNLSIGGSVGQPDIGSLMVEGSAETNAAASAAKVSAAVSDVVNAANVNTAVSAAKVSTAVSAAASAVKVNAAVSAANMSIGTFGGEGKMTMKGATASVAGTVHIGGKEDSLGGTGSLHVSDSVMHADKLFLGAGGKGSITMTEGGKVQVANMSIGTFGGEGKMTMKGATTGVAGTLYIGGKEDSLGGTGSLHVSDSVMHADKLFLGAGGTGSVSIDSGEVIIDSIVFGNTPTSQATITINGGHLIMRSATTARAEHAIILNGGAIATQGHDKADISGPGKLRLEEKGGTIRVDTRLTINSQIEGSGPLTITETGTLILSANNTYTGSTIVQVDTLANNGAPQVMDALSGEAIPPVTTLIAGGTNTLSPNSSIHLGSATALDINGAPQVIGALSGEATSTVTNNGPTAESLTIGNNNASGKYAGSIKDGKSYISIHKVGSGTQILTGNNTYTAGTTIHESILQVGDGGTTGSIVGNIKNSGTFVHNRSDEVWLPGTIVGSGVFIKEGTGNLIFEKKNEYSGTTFIKSGTLSQGEANTFSPNSDVSMEVATVLDLRGKDGRVGGLSGTTGAKVTNSGTSKATLTVGANNSHGDFIGNIENGATAAVSLNKDGTGTQILSGTNSYSGKTIINNGTLAIGAVNASSAHSDVVIHAKGTLDIRSHESTIGSLSGSEGAKVTSTGTGKTVLNIGDTNASGTFHGVITNDQSSSLSINKVGTGTQVFTGDNTNTGAIVISSGAIQLGNGGTTGSFISSEIQNDGVLAINRSDVVTLGTIHGIGSLAQIGSGTTILIGDNTYTGNTNIDAGTLVGTTSSLQKNISNRGRLVFKQSATGAFTGTISGPGEVMINSPGGRVIFNSDHTYTGSTVIQTGALSVNAQLQSIGVAIQKNGVLSGKGVVGGDVTNSGIMSRGDEPLALTIKGNYTQDVGGKFITQLGANSYDQLRVEGNTQLNGALEVGLIGEYIPAAGSEFNIINAMGTGTIAGAFVDLYLPQKVPLEILYGTKSVRLLVPTAERAAPLPPFTPFEGPRMKSVTLNTGHLAVNTRLNSENIFVGQNATLSGIGVLSGRLINSGVVSPGNNGSVGTMTVDGDFVQNPSGTLVIGIQDGDSHDRLRISGTAQLDGALQVNLPDKFDPPDNQLSMSILTADGGVSRTFSRSNLDATAASGVAYGTNEVQIVVTSTFEGQNFVQQVMADAINTIISASTVESTAVPKADSPATTPAVSGDGASGNAPAGTIAVEQGSSAGGSSTSAAGIASVAATSGTEDPPVGASSTENPSSERATAPSKLPRDELYKVIWILATLPPDEAAALLERLAPLIVLNIKDIIFNAANTQYGQLTARLAAMRAGVPGVSLDGLPWEPMSAELGTHEAKAIKDKKGTIAYLQEPSRWDVFASASGVFSKINNPNDLPRINSMTGYFCAGADYDINDYVNTGVYVGYQGFKAWYSDGAWLRSNGVKFGLYGTARWEGFYLNAIVGGGANFVNMNRPINIKHLNWVARSYPFAGELNSLLGGGYEFNLGPWRFGINNSIQYTYLGISSFQEFGAGDLNVRGGPHNPSSLVYSLGGNIYYLWQIFPGYQVLPTIGLAWQHEFLNYGQRIVGTFTNGLGAPFYFYTQTGARNNAFGTAGVTAQLGRHTGMYAYYSPQFGGGQIVSHGVVVGLIHHF